MAMQGARLHFQAEIEHFRAGLVEMASVVLSQVERAVAAWEQVDAVGAAEVMAADDQVDERCAAPTSTRRSSASSSWRRRWPTTSGCCTWA
jgi:hypothetical protein